MAVRSNYFHWWYLLLLLPVLLYFGARWYVGHRIDAAITAANEGENTLIVSEYSFGFFPIELAVRGLEFDQTRETFSASGRLDRGSFGGVHLWSLFGDDPIEVNRLALSGIDVRMVRTSANDSQPKKDNIAITVGDFTLDSTFLEIDDQVDNRLLRVANLDVAMQTFQLPFQPTQIRKLRLAADSTHYQRQEDRTSITATAINYDTEAEAIVVNTLRLQRGDSTDIRAEIIRLSGLNGQDVEGMLSIDSLSVAKLDGGARVQRNQQPASTSGNSTPIQLGTLSLPDVNLNLSGSFGSVHFIGELSAQDLLYQDSFSLKSSHISGRRIAFQSKKDLAVEARNSRIDQGPLQLPLSGNTPGPTSINISDLLLTTNGQNVSLSNLRYQSDSAAVTTNRIELSGDKANGTIAALSLTGIDRASLLAGKPLTIPVAVLTDSRLRIRQNKGGHFQLNLPTIELSNLVRDDEIHIERAQLSNGTVSRRTAEGAEDLKAYGIYLDQSGIRIPFSKRAVGETKLRSASIRMIGNREPIDYHYLNLVYDSWAGTLTLDSINRINRLSPEEVFSQKIDKSWLSFSFDGIRASGIDHAALVAGERVLIDSLRAGDFRLRVVEDISLELPSKEKLMPIEALRKIGPRIILNQGHLSSTDIAYGVVDSILEPKTIHFGSGTVRISGLDTEVSNTDSFLVSLDAIFEQTTPIHTEFALSRDSSGRNYAVRGQMSSYDLSRINPLMEVAANAIVETGVIDSLSYHGLLQDEVLTGEMTLLYHDLDLKVVGSGAWIKNLLSGLVMKESNALGEDFRQGTMYHEHMPTKSFFNAYWKGLVSGMKSSALSDIALQKELE